MIATGLGFGLGGPLGAIAAPLGARAIGGLFGNMGGLGGLFSGGSSDVSRLAGGIYSGTPYGGGSTISLSGIGSRMTGDERAAMGLAGLESYADSGLHDAQSIAEMAERMGYGGGYSDPSGYGGYGGYGGSDPYGGYGGSDPYGGYGGGGHYTDNDDNAASAY